MNRRFYSRADVETHSDGFRESRPAVNVKVYRTIQDAFKEYAQTERTDSRFTLDWVEEHVSEESLGWVFDRCCEFEFEYLEGWATGSDEAEDELFPADHRVSLHREGRSGGWIAVDGLPDLEEWDAIMLARWRKFERIARAIADGIPLQMLASLESNEFEWWSEEQDDAAVYNAELPVDMVKP